MSTLHTTAATVLFLAIVTGPAVAGARQEAKALMDEDPSMAKLEAE